MPNREEFEVVRQETLVRTASPESLLTGIYAGVDAFRTDLLREGVHYTDKDLDAAFAQIGADLLTVLAKLERRAGRRGESMPDDYPPGFVEKHQGD